MRFWDKGKPGYEKAPDPKALKLIAGADHDDIPQAMGLANYLEAIGAWIELGVSARTN